MTKSESGMFWGGENGADWGGVGGGDWRKAKCFPFSGQGLYSWVKNKSKESACFKERELHQGRGDCVSRAKNSALHAVGAHGIFAQ